MSSFTCNSCGLQFSAIGGQREHMKTDWHSYNLKRRVAQLPPINEATFNAKVKAFAEQDTEPEKQKQMTKKEARRREKEALLAKKKELLEQARESILKNMQKEENNAPERGPSEQLVEVPQKEDAQNIAETTESTLTPDQLAERLMQQKLENKVDIPLNVCLFCTRKREFTDLDTNLDHMFKSHGFYIPEQKYLVDKEGLVKYMSEKIGLGNVCLVCSYQGRSLEAVRAHMLSKSHCRVPYELEDERLEISEFYDFSGTYANQEAHVVGADAGDDDGEWEDVDSDDDGEQASDEDLPQDYIYNDGVELHLPTGVKVGHRSLQKYYRQNLKPESVLTEGQGTLIAAETRHFATVFDPKQIATQKRVWQTEVKDKKRDDKRAAKFVNNQPHYRDQLLQ
ncbi:LAQU0S02e05688g1_1 [Lachancea quebecensis]|uniref:LAQU0S02e05688g1_1 n=1 Tax=Lachancea quebecensis TaxID=1654605 RepID=A0A0P1KNH9_9SACH|nr:LAQU0S02e05688g1_1 [Lachancea quebecensis]